MELLEDNIGENLNDLVLGDDILDITSKARYMKEMIGRLDFIKFKNLFSLKDTIKRMKRQSTDWEKLFARDMSGKRLLSKAHR